MSLMPHHPSVIPLPPAPPPQQQQSEIMIASTSVPPMSAEPVQNPLWTSDGDGDAGADTDARDGAAAPALAASKQKWERARGATALGKTWGTAVSQGAARQLATDETLLRELQRKATQVHEAQGLPDYAQARMAELQQLTEGSSVSRRAAGAVLVGRAGTRLRQWWRRDWRHARTPRQTNTHKHTQRAPRRHSSSARARHSTVTNACACAPRYVHALAASATAEEQTRAHASKSCKT